MLKIPARVFIIGASNSGKTPLAKRFSRHTHVSAGENYRGRMTPCGDRAKDTEAMRQIVIRELREDHHANARYLQKRVDAITGPVVIEGIRNPCDFNALYRSGDLVIHLVNLNPEITPSLFDIGVEVIERQLRWMGENGMIEPSLFHTLRFDSFFGRDGLEDQFKARFSEL